MKNPVQISVEISMYPLKDDFIPSIDKFLRNLHATEGLKVQTNQMSTQVFGPASTVFSTLEKLIEDSYQQEEQCSFVMKVLSGDVSRKEIPNYHP